ncbi:hypothetical protein [Paenibacillus peoriae]|uniref:hypothetical protein n=1 Tax=Paenibacillus peoriae TaxID=59893 RepID=UPI00096F7C8E|nr:hypothetical protein [Paenibacillus peoriae]OMF46600.1 hypothetical protein BK135_12255 [Paenibacillus peoriae]
MTTPNIDVIREVGFQMSREYGDMMNLLYKNGEAFNSEMSVMVDHFGSLIGDLMLEVGPDPRSKEEQALDTEGLNDKEHRIADYFFILSGVRASERDKELIKEIASIDVPIHTILVMMGRCSMGYHSLHKNEKIRTFGYFKYVVTLFLEARYGIEHNGLIADESIPLDEQEHWKKEAVFLSPDWMKKMK